MRRKYLCLLAAIPMVMTTIAFAEVDSSKTEAGTQSPNVKVAEGGNNPLLEHQSSSNASGTGGGNSDRDGSRPKKLEFIEVEETVHHCVVDNCW